MNNPIKLDPIVQPTVKEVRKLHDTVDSNVRALRSLGTHAFFISNTFISNARLKLAKN